MKHLQKLNSLKILVVKIDLEGVQNSKQLFSRFNEAFRFTENPVESFGALSQSLSSLTKDSEYIKSVTPEPDGVHLVLENYDEYRNALIRRQIIGRIELDKFEEALFESCKSTELRLDGKVFTLEHTYGNRYLV